MFTHSPKASKTPFRKRKRGYLGNAPTLSEETYNLQRGEVSAPTRSPVDRHRVRTRVWARCRFNSCATRLRTDGLWGHSPESGPSRCGRIVLSERTNHYR